MQHDLEMTPVYGRCGTVIGWIEDDVLFDMTGRWNAFIDDDTVYTFKGTVLGFYEDGWFRDPRGDAVAFTAGHGDEGPVAPVIEPAPLPPALDCPPLSPTPMEFPVSPIASVEWSIATWGEFITGTGAMNSLY